MTNVQETQYQSVKHCAGNSCYMWGQHNCHVVSKVIELANVYREKGSALRSEQNLCYLQL